MTLLSKQITNSKRSQNLVVCTEMKTDFKGCVFEVREMLSFPPVHAALGGLRKW